MIHYCIVKDKDWIYFVKELSFVNILLEGTRKYWYILFICICYFIFPALFKFIDKSKTANEVITKVLVLAVAVTLFDEMLSQGNAVLYPKVSLMTVRFFSYFVGILFGYLSYNKVEITKGHYLGMLSCLIFVVLADSDNNALRTYCKFISITSLTILVVILFSKIDKCKPITLFRKVIEWFGRYSLEIYLIHVSVRRVFNSYKLYPCKIEYLISYIAISLLLVPIVHWLSLQIEKPINKLFKKTTEKKTV